MLQTLPFLNELTNFYLELYWNEKTVEDLQPILEVLKEKVPKVREFTVCLLLENPEEREAYESAIRESRLFEGILWLL